MALAAWLAVASVAAAADMATTRVVRVEASDGALDVVLEAGRLDGLAQDAQVTLLREGESIVHPLTGETLGVPQEPVGIAQIYEVEDRQAKGALVKTYSTPQIDDLAEYEKTEVAEVVPGRPEAKPAQVEGVMARVKDLEKNMARYAKSQKTIAAYPVFAQQVWDELNSMKSYLVALDERLVELEAQQGEDRSRLNAVLRGEYQGEEVKEFTIRYSPDADVRLQVAGTTLVIRVERDSLQVEKAGYEELGFVEDEELLPEKEAEAGAWFESPYVLGGGLLLIVGLTGVILFVIKRRYDDVMEGLEEFDEEYLGEEEEEE